MTSRWLMALAAVAAASCGNNPTQPSTATLVISCPAPITAASADGSAVAVAFSPPTTSGGQAPVSTTCTNASGSAFPLGSTTVTCTATDAQHRVASCTFPVVVQKAPHLGLS